MITIDSSADLTLSMLEKVACDGEALALTPTALERIDRRREEFLAYVQGNSHKHLYGITTRHHTSADELMDEESRREYGSRLPSTPASFGEALPERLVRMIIVCRLADVLNGTACLRSDTVRRILRMLDEQLPPVPSRGNGDPGDIIPLGHLFRAELNGTLELGEGMAVINGSPVATAALCDIALSGRQKHRAALHVFSLAAVATGAPEGHYDVALETAWNDPHQAFVLARMRELMDGRGPASRPYQAAVSFRSAPRLLGWLTRCQRMVEECAEIALPASSNNPIFVGPDSAAPLGAIVPNGGFHNALASPTIDAAARSWADVCQLATAQLNQLLEDPVGLRVLEPEPQITTFYMPSTAWAEQARESATASLTSIASTGQTDTGTRDLDAWRKAHDAGDALMANLGLLAVTAAHTIARRDQVVPPSLKRLQEGVLQCLPIGTSPLRYGEATQAVATYMATI